MDFPTIFVQRAKWFPIPNYLKPYMSPDDYAFIKYYEWLDDEFLDDFNELSKLDLSDSASFADLIDPVKVEKYRALKNLMATVNYELFYKRPMEDFLKPYISEEDYRFYDYMRYMIEFINLNLEFRYNVKLPADFEDPLKIEKFDTLERRINEIIRAQKPTTHLPSSNRIIEWCCFQKYKDIYTSDSTTSILTCSNMISMPIFRN